MFQRVALYLQDAHDLRDGLDYVRYAEEKGFEAVWQAESSISTRCNCAHGCLCCSNQSNQNWFGRD